jgi:hypothetical protein
MFFYHNRIFTFVLPSQALLEEKLNVLFAVIKEKFNAAASILYIAIET